MKKFLSVMLAVAIVFSTVAFAIPSAVTVTDTAEEQTLTEDADADLQAQAYKIKRGINMLTGSKEALTGENWGTFGGLFTTAYGDTTVKAGVNPDDASDDVFVFNIPSPAREDRVGDYVNFRVNFGPWLSATSSYTPLSEYIDHTYMYIAFDVKKEVVDASAGYTAGDSYWIMNSSVASGDESFLTPGGITPTAGWTHIEKVVNLTWTNQDSSKSTTVTDPQYIVFHTYVDNANGTDVNFYYDNMIIAPAYKVTYYNAAGTTVVKEDYIAQDEDGNLLTAFAPAGFLEGATTYSGWAETVGGTPVESIALTEDNNADIVLYATQEVAAFDGASIALSDKLTEVGKSVTASAVLTGTPDIEADYVTWTSSDASVFTASKNKDGSATVTAKKAGSATLTYTYAKGGVSESVSRTVVVATEPIVDPSGTDLGIDLETYEYITVNVTNTFGADVTLTVRCRVTVDGTTSTVNVEIPVPAGATNVDVYADLTENEAWTGTLNSIAASGTGITVNNKKLWAELSTELGLKFTSDAEFIGTPNSTLNIGADVDCDLEGVYDKAFTWSYDVTNNCATVTEKADGSLDVTVGENKEGFVTITATSDEDASISITRKIYVKTGAVDSSKAVAYTWDFENSSNTGWANGGGHHGQSHFSNGGVTIIKTVAKLSSETSTVPVSAVSGSSGYTLTKNTGGSVAEYGNNSTNFSMSDYPYFCFRAKSENPGTYSVKVYFTVDGQSHSESKAITKTFDITDSYKTFTIDTSTIAAMHPDENYGGIMFVNLAESVIDASTITSDVASSPLTYSTYKPLIVDEMFFANYDASDKVEVGVNLTADKTSLVGEGTFTLTSEVYASEEISTKEVKYTADSDIVTVFNNGDGTATVTPVGNGTVTITATSSYDETASDSVTLTITGVQKKLVAYDLSMVSLGNSYLCHGYAEWFDKSSYNGWIDETDVIRGMAASEADLDYYGRIQYYLNENFNCSLKANRFANNKIEIAWMQGLADSSDTSNHENFDYTKARTAILEAMTEQLNYIRSEQTNIITIQLAENARFGSYGEIASFFYDTVFSAVDEVRPEESVVVVITPFGSNAATSAEIMKAQEYGFLVANCTDMTDRKWQAYDQYPDFDNPNAGNDFRSHPGDLGMDEIGKRVFAQLEDAIPSAVTASYIYVPDTISITGGNAITTDEGTLQLSVAAEPSENSTTSVFWSVDNENVATIDENGLLTAVNNGTVKVTAVCAYDSSVTATLDVAVSGQVEAFTLTYSSGTSDTVTGLPAADEYAKGTYTLSTSAPDRNGYKFLGWSLTEGGAPVKTVEMTADITVYATWEFATEWEFDTEGDLEGISLGGFHTYCRYEEVPGMVVATVTSYGDGVTVYDDTLLIPTADYNEFAVRLQPNNTTSSDCLNLTVTNNAGTKYEYSLPMTTTAMTEYVFDISDVEGTITGFLLKPTVVELSLYVDYIRFQKSADIVTVTEDTTVDSLDASSNVKIDASGVTYTVNNKVTVATDATLCLEAGGTYVFGGGLTGNVVASPNANVIITGDAPDNYIKINIGERQNASNVRYAEVDGNQYEIKENGNVYGIITDDNLVVQIVEKLNTATLASDAVTESTLTSYYYVDASSDTYALLPMGNYMSNVEGQEIRLPDEKTNNTPGLRFKAGVTPDSKNETASYKITEFGYIVALEDTLAANDEQLNFNCTSPYVSGKAFVRGEYDKVYDSSSDALHIFTGVLYGAPEEHYGKNIVAKTYTIVTVAGENYVIYGEEMVANYFEIAQMLDNAGGLSEDVQALVDDIIDKTLGSDTGVDWGDL